MNRRRKENSGLSNFSRPAYHLCNLSVYRLADVAEVRDTGDESEEPRATSVWAYEWELSAL